MRRLQGCSCPQGFSSISQFQHKSTHVSCSRKVNSITRSTLLCSRASHTAARQPRLENTNLKLFASQLRKAGIFSLSKTTTISFVFSYTKTGKDANLVKSSLTFKKETDISGVQHFIQVWFYIKREQASQEAHLVYRKIYSLKVGYYLSLNITNTLCELYSP